MTATGAEEAAADEEGIGFADDMLSMSVHAATHWDALSHVYHHHTMYNARDSRLITDRGAAVNDITPMASRLVTRGVLVDVARYRGLDALSADHEIGVEDLQGALAAQRVDISSGDALLIRTGHMGRIRTAGNWQAFTERDGFFPQEPGLSASCLPWISEHGICAVACDNWAVEWLPGGPVCELPVHVVGIVHMGLALGEMFDLDHLAAVCGTDGRYDFMLAAGPLPLKGGVGGPVNPLAIR
jgi:kynurenine formamidase